MGSFGAGTYTVGITGGGTATFQIMNLVPSNSSVSNSTGQFSATGDMRLVSDTDPTYSFGPANEVWQFSVAFANSGTPSDFTIVPGSPGSITIIGDSPGIVSFSAFDTLTTNPPNGGGTPEPATLATFGLLTLVGGVVARRKLKAAPVA